VSGTQQGSRLGEKIARLHTVTRQKKAEIFIRGDKKKSTGPGPPHWARTKRWLWMGQDASPCKPRQRLWASQRLQPHCLGPPQPFGKKTGPGAFAFPPSFDVVSPVTLLLDCTGACTMGIWRFESEKQKSRPPKKSKESASWGKQMYALHPVPNSKTHCPATQGGTLGPNHHARAARVQPSPVVPNPRAPSPPREGDLFRAPPSHPCGAVLITCSGPEPIAARCGPPKNARKTRIRMQAFPAAQAARTQNSAGPAVSSRSRHAFRPGHWVFFSFPIRTLGGLRTGIERGFLPPHIGGPAFSGRPLFPAWATFARKNRICLA